MLTYVGMIMPDTKLEEKLWRRGLKYVVGVDEAGRGPLAGPVVVGAVLILSKSEVVDGVRDSKMLSKNQREALYEDITKCSTAWGIGIVNSNEIDRMGIKNAVKEAMILAVSDVEKKLKNKIEYVISDGAVYLLDDRKMLSINHGDMYHYSISAASIIAKVTRDRIMDEYAKKFPKYGFEKHMGYGTKLHLEAISKYGICDIHRRSYAPIKKAL